MSSSKVLAGGEVSSKMPAKGAVWCQWTELGGGRRKDCKGASHNGRTGHSKDFGDDDETGTRP